MRLARSLDPDPGTHIKTHATPDATQGESNPNCASWRRPAGRLRWCECTSVCVSKFGVSTPGNDRVLHSKMSGSGSGSGGWRGVRVLRTSLGHTGQAPTVKVRVRVRVMGGWRGVRVLRTSLGHTGQAPTVKVRVRDRVMGMEGCEGASYFTWS